MFSNEIFKSIDNVKVNGSFKKSSYTILNFRFPISIDKKDLISFKLELAGIACSSGSACQSGSSEPSHVLSEILSEDEMKKISSISNSNEFNVYSLVWTKEKIYWLLNNNVTYEHKNMDVMPFDNNHYLLLNLAIGGVLGGKVPRGFSEERMVIDYVRIFQ